MVLRMPVALLWFTLPDLHCLLLKIKANELFLEGQTLEILDIGN